VAEAGASTIEDREPDFLWSTGAIHTGMPTSIMSLVIYTAPLHLKYDGLLGGKLDADIVLPMIKLQEQDGSPFPPGLMAMRELLLKRADRSLFASDAEVEQLVAFSAAIPANCCAC
jgi:hypothetical protein